MKLPFLASASFWRNYNFSNEEQSLSRLRSKPRQHCLNFLIDETILPYRQSRFVSKQQQQSSAKLSKHEREAEARRPPRFEKTQTHLATLFGILFSPLFCLDMALGKLFATLGWDIKILDILASKLSATQLTNIEICLTFLMLAFCRFALGLPLEWLAMAYFWKSILDSCFNFDSAESVKNIRMAFITSSVMLFASVPFHVTHMFADLSFLVFFVQDAGRRFRGKWEISQRDKYILAACSIVVSLTYSWLSLSSSSNFLFQSIAAPFTASIGLFQLFNFCVRAAIGRLSSLFEALNEPIVSLHSIYTTEVSDTHFRLHWTLDLDIARSVALEYRVEINGILIGGSKSTNVLITDLQPGKSYRIRVFAIAGEHWTPSLPTYARTLFHPPKKLGNVVNNVGEPVGQREQALKSLVDDRELLQLHGDLVSLRTQREELAKQIEELENGHRREIEEIQREIERLKESNKEIATNADLIRQKADLKAAEDVKRDLDACKSALQSKLDSLKAEHLAIVEEVELKQEEMDHFKTEKVRLERELEDGAHLSEKKERMLKEDVARLTGIVLELTKAIERKQTDMTRFQSEEATRLKQLAKQTVQNAALKQKIATIQRERVEKRADFESNTVSLKLSNEEIALLRHQIQQVCQNKDRLKAEVETLNERENDNSLHQYQEKIRHADLLDPSDESIDDILEAVNLDRLQNDYDDIDFPHSLVDRIFYHNSRHNSSGGAVTAPVGAGSTPAYDKTRNYQIHSNCQISRTISQEPRRTSNPAATWNNSVDNSFFSSMLFDSFTKAAPSNAVTPDKKEASSGNA